MADSYIRIYEELANRHHFQGEPQLRDRMLLLAADAAYREGRNADAERLRQRLLELNPHHLLKPFPSLAEAMTSTDVKSYVEGLRRTYPREQAELAWQQQRGGQATPSVPAAEPVPSAEPAVIPVAAAVPAAIPIAPAQATPVIPVAPPPPTPPVSQGGAFSDPGPAPPRRRRQEAGWLAPLLFILVMVGAFTLALYTLVKPILQL